MKVNIYCIIAFMQCVKFAHHILPNERPFPNKLTFLVWISNYQILKEKLLVFRKINTK